jgi:DNA-binding PadR family transcriptional regulator
VDHLPLPSHVFLILLSLLESERHGYALLKDVERRTDGETRLGTSTLYAALKRLLAQGLIAEVPPPADAVSDDSRRRYYRATAFGTRVAEAEAQRVRRLGELIAGVPALASGPRRRRGER